MSNPIERAAERIVRFAQGCDCDDCKHQVRAIIRDELFREVKPDDVREGGWYIVTMPGHPIAVREPWTKDGVTMFGSYPASECKIHGRVPMPE